MQLALKDREMTILNFVTDIEIVLTKDEVYIRRNEPWSPDFKNLKFWDSRLIDNFDTQNYYTIEFEESEEIEKIINDIFEKCKYEEQIWPIKPYLDD